jgi:pimeloyl-ACP methyl ester carboxylesterase
MAWLADELRERGIGVAAPGWSATHGWDRAVSDVEAAVTAARSGVVLVGQSAGALLALAIGAARSDVVEAVVMLNPLMVGMDVDTREFFTDRVQRGSYTIPGAAVTIVDPNVVDPDPTDEIDLRELFVVHDAADDSSRWLTTLRAPLTVLLGEDDDVLGPEHTDRIIEFVPHAEVRSIGGGHLASLDIGRAQVRDTIVEQATITR